MNLARQLFRQLRDEIEPDLKILAQAIIGNEDANLDTRQFTEYLEKINRLASEFLRRTIPAPTGTEQLPEVTA